MSGVEWSGVEWSGVEWSASLCFKQLLSLLFTNNNHPGNFAICSSPPTLQNARFTSNCSQQYPSTICNFLCDDNYLAFSDTVTCRADGNWSDPVVCAQVVVNHYQAEATCDSPDCLASATLVNYLVPGYHIFDAQLAVSFEAIDFSSNDRTENIRYVALPGLNLTNSFKPTFNTTFEHSSCGVFSNPYTIPVLSILDQDTLVVKALASSAVNYLYCSGHRVHMKLLLTTYSYGNDLSLWLDCGFFFGFFP